MLMPPQRSPESSSGQGWPCPSGVWSPFFPYEGPPLVHVDLGQVKVAGEEVGDGLEVPAEALDPGRDRLVIVGAPFGPCSSAARRLPQWRST
jgi:hypothetical protein